MRWSEPPAAPTVPDLVSHLARHAAERPLHPAVIQGGDVTTYGEFWSRVRRIAAALASHSEKPKVLIHLAQGADAYASMMATAFAGGYYAPNNVTAPAAKQRQIFEQFAPEIVVASRGDFLELVAGHQGPRPAHVEPSGIDVAAPLACARPAHDLAYVIFTSGSTGLPKGVVIPRSALAHFVDWALAAMDIAPTDRMSQHPNIAFDLSVLDIYAGLCGGATLFPLTSATHRLMPARAIRELGLTIWNSVPSVVALMMRADQVDRVNLESLRLMTFCGEPLLETQLDCLFAARPDLIVHNTYGPTEATVSCTLQRLTATDYRRACRGTAALGQAVPGMRLHLVSTDLADKSELAITGPQLARGYWNGEKSTADAFRPIRVGDTPVPAFYTGDLVERFDRHIFFAGRRDLQVKILGHRLELEEVNAALRKCGYLAVASMLIDGELHAFLETDGAVDTESLRSRLAEFLESAAVPLHFHPVHSLPRNANDKLDIAALAARRK